MHPGTIKLALIIFIISIVAAISSTIIYVYFEPQTVPSTALVVLSAIFILPYLILFNYIYKRKNWARYLWLLVFVLGNIMMFGGHGHAPTEYHYTLLKYFSYLQTLLQALITILLFLPASNRWFKIKEEKSIE